MGEMYNLQPFLRGSVGFIDIPTYIVTWLSNYVVQNGSYQIIGCVWRTNRLRGGGGGLLALQFLLTLKKGTRTFCFQSKKIC